MNKIVSLNYGGKSMVSHRCAVCGSPNVIKDVQAGGVSYNYAKGIVGTVVLGSGGAVAGIESKQQQVFICQDCGMTLTYEMPAKLRNAINMALISEFHRDYILVDGVGRLSWSILKKQYKNIEPGLVDRIIESKQRIQERNLLSYATATREEFDQAVDIIVDFERRLSAKGSIYDKLPEDAFSDEKPMTLEEYYVWQDAIAIFVENVAKYLPYPLVRYRNLSDTSMELYFTAYLYEKVNDTYGHFPEFTGFRHCEDFKNYAEENPFVLYFADKYFPETFVPFGTVDTKVINWTPERLADILRSRRRLRFVPTMINIIFKFRGSDNKEIMVSHDVPRYIVKNGRLGYWHESNPHNRVPDGAATIEAYFTEYPEKRAEFNVKVDAHNKQALEKNILNKKVEELKRSVEANEEKINANKNEIAQLQKKIFGKKAAIARAEALETENVNVEKNIIKIKDEINMYTKKMNDIDDQKFYDTLAKEMDYFIAWHWCE